MMGQEAYAAAKNLERANKSQQAVAYGLEEMSKAVEEQDKLIRACVKTAKDAKHTAEDALALAKNTDNTANTALDRALDNYRLLNDFRAMTVLAKFQWLFRGPWW